MAYGCAGSSPAFRTILKGSNNAKLLFPFVFSELENLSCPFSRYATTLEQTHLLMGTIASS